MREGNRREGKVREEKESIAAASRARADGQRQQAVAPEPPSPTSLTTPVPLTDDRLDVEGLAIFQALTGEDRKTSVGLIGVVLKHAPADSQPKVMQLLREAERGIVDDPRKNLVRWLGDRLKTPAPPTPARQDCPALQPGYPISKMPQLSDAPHRWADLAQDGKFGVDEHGISRPMFDGFYVDTLARNTGSTRARRCADCTSADHSEKNYANTAIFATEWEMSCPAIHFPPSSRLFGPPI